ncbi:MAG TPA: TetR/AcrR family transcriptional regulator [Acidimicrobiales bacterium]|nr:TetR/AcrR family transcriptional regulator [Acidimicrobiales bacterium]
MTFRASFEHRDELLRAALDEFCERGFDAASVNRILAASGVSKGQLYHHFASKEDLYLALVEWAMDEKAAWFATHQPPPAEGDDLVDTLGTLLRATLVFAAAHPDVDRLSRALLAERGRPIFDEVTRRFAFDPASAIGTLVAERHRNGALQAGLDVAFVQRVVLLLVNHAPDLLDLRRPADLDAGLDQLLALLRNGLTRRTPT